MDYKEKLAQAAQLFASAKAIYENKDKTTEDVVNAEKMLTDARQLKAEAGQLKDIEAASAEILANLPAAPAEAKTAPKGKFASWADFLYAAWRAQHKNPAFRKEDSRLVFVPAEKEAGHETKDMVENIGASGGFLVPPEYLAQLQGVLAENSIVRPRATVIRMSRRELQLPVVDQTATTSGVPHWFGGMTFDWTEEATQKSQDDPEFKQVNLVAHKLIGYTVASDELVADSAISLSDFLGGPMGFAGGVSWMEDYAFIQGSGAGQPLGVINAGATLVVPRAAGGAIGYADLCNMMEDFLPSGRGVWVITQSALADLLQLNGPAANPEYIWGSAVTGAPNTLLGLPVIWSEKCPRIGTQGDVILADWRYYLIGDRQNTTIESTQYDQWRYDKTSWRVVHRVDGQPWLSAPITYADGTSQVSPFVILGDKTT